MPIDVTPASVSFSRLTAEASRDPTLIRKATITNNMQENAELSGLRSTNPTFSPELTVVEPGRKFELSVRFASPPKPGSTNANIELTTNLKELPTLSIPVNVFVAPDVEVMPATLSLPAEQTAPLTRQLNVRNNAKEPIELSDLKASNPDVKLTVETTQPGMIFRINVDIPAGFKVSPQGDRITFKTTSPGMPEVRVPISQLAMSQSAGQAGPPTTQPRRIEDPKAALEGRMQIRRAPEEVRVVDPNAASLRGSQPVRAMADPSRLQQTIRVPDGQGQTPAQPESAGQGETKPSAQPQTQPSGG